MSHYKPNRPRKYPAAAPHLKNNKALGQHWLKNRFILDDIADLAVVPEVKTCLEIGPGLGTLTSSLLRRFQKVIAVEFDADLARKLPGSFPGKNLEVINQDILQLDFVALFAKSQELNRAANPDAATSEPTVEPYVVAGNIPYYITSPIIKKLLEATPRPAKIVLLIQKEVAERAAAEPGDHSLLSLATQNLATVELGPVVPAEEFTPPPKVDSQVLILTPRPAPQIPAETFELIKHGFSAPRKKLVANLADGKYSKANWRDLLTAQNLNPDARAEDLSLQDWQKLYKVSNQ